MPRMLKFMSFMLAIATFVLIETIILKLMTQSKQTPAWVKRFTDFLVSNAVLKYFVASPIDGIEAETIIEPVDNQANDNPDATGESSSEQHKTKPIADWMIFCRLIDRILFVALVVGYRVAYSLCGKASG